MTLEDIDKNIDDVKKLETRKDELRAILKREGFEPWDLIPATKPTVVKTQDEFRHIIAELGLEREKLIASQVQALNESSKRVENLTSKLNSLTNWLRILTIVLAGVAIADLFLRLVGR